MTIPTALPQSDIISAGWRDYLVLTKPKVVAVMMMTSLVGMLLAANDLPSFWLIVIANLGIGLSAASAACINHVVDRQIDAQMNRTRHRPVAEGTVQPLLALFFAAVLGVTGIGLLIIFVNSLTAWLTLFSVIGYAVIYTLYLKRATPQNIVIGGLAGASPPLLGWVAVTGSVDPNALLLVAIIFAWTPPHFWALCIARREEYALVEMPMLPVTHGVEYTKLQMVLYSIVMVITTVLPLLTGMCGSVYLAGMLVLNFRFMYFVFNTWRSDSRVVAMELFSYSIRYIMWLFLIFLIDHFISVLLF